ncbi:MAG: HIRAN domain-containing protein [Saccharofermentans sp.]|nr:HIRAN domain-containing protein [Saccharofermentans sp.]
MDIFVSIVDCDCFWGTDMLRRGDKLTLIKEKDNPFPEAILAVYKPLGSIGYVADLCSDSFYSAGRIYDKFQDEAEAEISFILSDGSVICRVKNLEMPKVAM